MVNGKKPKFQIQRATNMVPNFFTVANMALGFFAILNAVKGNWMTFSWAILFAHLMDVLDGRVARWLNKTSQFGMEFDSFADWISFGIAPAMGIYFFSLHQFGKLGMALAFFYTLCGAIRLTKFNLKTYGKTDEPPNYNFVGLPIPAAGGFLAIIVMLVHLFDSNNPGTTFPIIYNLAPHISGGIPLIMFGLSLMMVSRIQFTSFKKTHFFRPRSMYMFLVTLFTIFLVFSYPSNTIFILYVTYLMFGLVGTFIRVARMRGHKKDEKLAYTDK